MILVTTSPFGETNNAREVLKKASLPIVYNDVGRKLSPDEIISLLKKHNPTIIVAGTESYGDNLKYAPNLKHIARVGIGMDNIDAKAIASRNIIVTNTPDAPTNAVAELTVAQMLNMVRRVPYVMNELRDGAWYRHIGRELKNLQVGLIGFGRIGKRVHDLLQPFTSDIKLNDIDLSQYGSNVGYAVTKDEIYSTCDIISLHVPLDESTLDMVGADELAMMKPNACLLNMSRGGIVNEAAALAHVRSHRDFMLAIDTFTTEPYTGKLLRQFNVLPTPHLGSCSLASRKDMEVGAAENVLNMLF